MKKFEDLIFESDQKPLIMGILNVTPDSFSDGGRYITADKALVHARKMLEDGADIIDVGGESTRPGSEPVSAEEQIQRVVPVIKLLSSELKCCISIDTTIAQVASEALKSGACIINDISAFEDDPEMVQVAVRSGCPVILMHKKGKPVDMQNDPAYVDPVEDIFQYLSERVEYAIGSGVQRKNIVIDPGIGFGKTVEHNLGILKYIKRYKELGFPVLLGASRKSFIGKILKIENPCDRTFGDSAVIAYGCREGVNIFRVHDVLSCSQVVKMTKAIMRQ